MSMYESVFLGHDNVIDLVLTSDGDTVNIINTTRATAAFGSTLIDSETSLAAFDWSEGEEGLIHLTFGEESIPVGSYKVVLTLYDVINTDGVVWDDFRCRVVGEDLSPVPPTDPPILISQGGTGQSSAAAAFNALKQIATETSTGVTELATTGECVTGTDISRVVTPAGLTARMGSPSAIGEVSPAAGNFTVGHFGDDTNYIEFLSDGKPRFVGDARPAKIVPITGAQLLPTHHNPLHLISLEALTGIATDGLDTSASVSRRIEVVGINGGEQVKGRLRNTYVQGDTTAVSSIIKIKLTTTNATWTQAGLWRIILDISAGCVTGKFTIFMPSFSIMEYSSYEVYVTCDGATYLESGSMGFSRSMSGSSAATENFLNDEVAGSNVVIEVADTTGFYVGNEAFVSDSANSEWSRITAIVSNTSITVATLSYSYYTANGAKLYIKDYTQTAETVPIQRGLGKTKTFRAGINSGIEFQYGIPHDIDDGEWLGVMIQYVGTTTNAGADVSKWRIQWKIWQIFTPIDVSNQYANLVYTDQTPPATTINAPGALAAIAGVDHAGKHLFAAQIVRMGADAGDTYAGDIRVVGVAIQYTQDKMGYEP